MTDPLNYRATSIRTAAALTGTYVASTIIGNSDNNTPVFYQDNELILYVNVANLGNMTAVQFKIEFSDDLTNWYQECVASFSGGTETDTLLEHAVTAVGKYRVATQVKDRYARASFKGSGGDGTGSSLSAIAVFGTA